MDGTGRDVKEGEETPNRKRIPERRATGRTSAAHAKEVGAESKGFEPEIENRKSEIENL
jgi:hypothetical protein